MNRREMIKASVGAAAMTALGMEALLDEWHIPMERFRGLECRCAYAEAFVRHTVARNL